MKERSIHSFFVIPATHTSRNGIMILPDRIYALASDGTFWFKTGMDEWLLIRDLPQTPYAKLHDHYPNEVKIQLEQAKSQL